MGGYRHYNGPTVVQEEDSTFWQADALGISRRDFVLTHAYKEDQHNYIPTDLIQRRVDVNGTKENLAIKGDVKSKLSAWSKAWATLEGDGTADEDDLRAVNEGLGQTHRGKLQTDDSVRDYSEEAHYRGGFRGARGGRGTQGAGHGGRGGGLMGRASERAPPTKRTRVVRQGRDTTPLEKPVRLPPAKTSQAIRSKANATNGDHITIKFNNTAHTISVRPSNSKPQPPTVRAKMPNLAITSSTKAPSLVSSTPTRRSVNFTGSLAEPHAFMASILEKKTSKSKPAVAANLMPNSSVTEVNQAPKVTRETPVPAELKRATQEVALPLEKTREKIAPANVKALAPKAVPSSEVTERSVPVNSPPAQENLMDLEVDDEVPRQPVISFTHPQGQLPEQHPTGSRTNEASQAQVVGSTETFLQELEALKASGQVNSHFTAMLERIAKQIGPPNNIQPTPAVISDDKESGSKYSTSSLLSMRPSVPLPPKVKVTRPSAPPVPSAPSAPSAPPASLAMQMQKQRNDIIGEHIYRSHFAKSELVKKLEGLRITDEDPPKTVETKTDTAKKNPFGPPKPERSGPPMPAYLAHLPAVIDQGAAARQQYASTSTISKPARSGPSLPAHLANVSATTDHGAAARQQYSSTSAPAKPARSGPSLPPHLAKLPAITDPGAAARQQYDATSNGISTHGRGISSGHNSELRSFSGNEPAAAPAPRRSMLNRTGFIGLAENGNQQIGKK